MKYYKYTFFKTFGAIALFLPVCLRAQSLYLTPGVRIVVKGAPMLVLNNISLVNNGSFISDSGTVLFTGESPAIAAFVGGSNPVSFYNMVISKTFGDLQLDNNTAITGRIALDSGNLQLNDYTLDLGSSGMIIGEKNSSRITGTKGGTIRATAFLSNPQAVNPGNIGIEISSPVYMGTTVITRGHVLQTNSNGETSIQRYFDIAPDVNRSLLATLRFFYQDGELAGNDKRELTLYSNASGKEEWSLCGRDKMDTAANWIVKGNIDQMRRWILAKASEKMPANAVVRAYPNPTHDGFTLTFSSPTEKDVAIDLCDQGGKLLQIRNIHCVQGTNTVDWGIVQYAAGLYYLEFKNIDAKTIAILKQ